MSIYSLTTKELTQSANDFNRILDEFDYNTDEMIEKILSYPKVPAIDLNRIHKKESGLDRHLYVLSGKRLFSTKCKLKRSKEHYLKAFIDEEGNRFILCSMHFKKDSDRHLLWKRAKNVYRIAMHSSAFIPPKAINSFKDNETITTKVLFPFMEKGDLEFATRSERTVKTEEGMGVIQYINIFYLQQPAPEKNPHKILWQYAYKVICKVEQMHRLGIVHGDIKLTNILVDDQDELGFIDLEFAYVKDDPVKINSGYGTTAFMSPETWQNSIVTEKSDIWSLGGLLWELLAEVEGCETKCSIRWGLKFVDWIKTVSQTTTLNPSFIALLKDMFIQDPEKRPSAEEVRKRFERICSSESLLN